MEELIFEKELAKLESSRWWCLYTSEVQKLYCSKNNLARGSTASRAATSSNTVTTTSTRAPSMTVNSPLQLPIEPRTCRATESGQLEANCDRSSAGGSSHPEGDSSSSLPKSASQDSFPKIHFTSCQGSYHQMKFSREPECSSENFGRFTTDTLHPKT